MKKFWFGFFTVLLFGGAATAVWVYTHIPKLRLASVVQAAPMVASPTSATATFLVVGDTGAVQPQGQKHVAALLEQLCVTTKPQGVLLLGDNFYMAGVDSEDDPQWRSKFEDMYNTPCLMQQKFYAILGNHDYRGNTEAQIRYTARQGRWVMPGRTYQIEAPPVLDIFVLDSNVPDWCGLGLCSLDDLRERIMHSQAPWRIVLGHHPILSAGRYAGNQRTLPQKIIQRFLCSSRIDLYFSGHDHNLQHLNSSVPCPLHQWVVGSGGADLYALQSSSHEFLRFGRSAWGAAVLQAKQETLRVELYEAGASFEGHPIYSYTYSKTNGTPE